MSEQEPVASSSGAECYLILHSVSKRHNIGTLLRSCTAFGVKQVCLVGSRQFNAFGSQGTVDYVPMRHFATLEACVQHLKEVEGCTIIGVEIDPAAAPVQHHPFRGNTAFMLGNEGQGMSDKQMRLCDAFVYIPQHGAGTASLNVTVAASIVLHHFAIWAGFAERGRSGAKFVVGERPEEARSRPRGLVPPTEAEAAEQAAAAVEGAAWMEELLQQGGLDGLMEGDAFSSE